MTHKTILVIALLLLAAPAAYGQDTELNIYGGLSAPQGDFADDSGDDAGYASFGLSVMGEYVQYLGTPGLGWASSASLLVNPADDDIINANDPDVGRYFILPVMTGLRYQTELSATLDGYAIGQAGLVGSRAPRLEVGDAEATSNNVFGFGFAFGAGIVLSDGINITARYLSLGQPEYEYEDDDGGEQDFEPSMRLFQVMIGIAIGD